MYLVWGGSVAFAQSHALVLESTPNTLQLGKNGSGSLNNYLSTADYTDPVSTTLTAVDAKSGAAPSWLKVNQKLLTGIPYTSGSELVFEFDAAGLKYGTYQATVTASAAGYESTSVELSLVVSDNAPATAAATNAYQINFSDQATATPNGWLKDYGQAYGDRGNGLTYGWLTLNGQTGLNLTTNARNRNKSGVDVWKNTLIHMQYGDIDNGTGTSGNKTEGIWEMALPNGTYAVSVMVGDPNAEVSNNPRHTINVENVTAINRYIPTGGDGSATLHKSASVTVSVNDGRLTLTAVGGFNTKINSVTITPTTSGGSGTPRVVGVTPANGATNQPLNSSISANELELPNATADGLYGVDNTTITQSTVRLYKGTTLVPANVNGTGGGDAIILTPASSLEPNTQYRFEINGVRDLTGVEFEPFSSTFTTGSGSNTGNGGTLDGVSFIKYGTVASGSMYTTLTIGPDTKLYGITIFGDIHRWTINSDGTLSNKEAVSSWKANYANSRTAVGLTFDPKSTASNLIAWVSHCSAGFNNAPEWDGKISRLSGPNLETEQLVVTNLPRSRKDHLTNSIAFKPGENNVLYFMQGSTSAGGAPDNAWGNRSECLLSAAMLRLDLNKLPQSSWPLDAKTTTNPSVINNAPSNSILMSDGTYNPYATNSPLTIYGSGIRNAYDLIWHTNGQCYIPANGTAGGSNTPASVNGTRRPNGTTYNFGEIPATTNNVVQRDWLFRVDPAQSVGYYGHPNPLRGEYVMNRGSIDVPAYPFGTAPDPNYRGAAYDFGFNVSPNGVIEYKSNAEGGKLKGAILVVRYSGGDDIVAMLPNGTSGNIGSSRIGIPGFNGFSDPLDLVEDTRNGNIYVSEYGSSKITLLKPNSASTPAPIISVSPETLVFQDYTSGGASSPQTVFITNEGNANLSNISITKSGTNAGGFTVNQSSLKSTLAPGETSSFTVTFNAALTGQGPKYAQLTIATSTGSVAPKQVSLKAVGLPANGEPSLQWIADTYFGDNFINIGDDNEASEPIHSSTPGAPLLGQEVSAQRFVRAEDAPVTLELISVYGPGAVNPTVAFGWYPSGNAGALNPLFTVSNTYAESINPIADGALEFDPGISEFGFYSRWPYFDNRLVFSEDALNTFSGAIPHHVRVYQVPGQANTYLIATEENPTGFDYNDVVVIARNVMPTSNTGGGKTLSFSPGNLTFNTYNGASTPQSATLTASSSINASNVTLTSNQSWVVLPQKSVGSPMSFDVNTAGLAQGSYTATVTASAPDFTSATLQIVANVNSGSATGPFIRVENMTKIPFTSVGFPADDYYSFNHNLSTSKDNSSKAWHQKNVMRIHNEGTSVLNVTGLTISGKEFVLENTPSTFSVQPGAYQDVTLKFVGNTNYGKHLFKSTLQIASNAGNGSVSVTLHGSQQANVQGGSEASAQDILKAFGFTTDMGQLGSDYPTDQDVNNGVYGDLVLSTKFKRADPNKPVNAFQILQLRDAGRGRFFLQAELGKLEGVGGVIYDSDSAYCQSILPRAQNDNTRIAGAASSTVSGTFYINIEGYHTYGRWDPNDKRMLGTRVYKVRDRNGNVIPNHYIVARDLIRSWGCGSTDPRVNSSNSGNCDFQDDIHYVINLRPANDPSAGSIPNKTVAAGSQLNYPVASYFNLGYPGNKLTYSAKLSNGSALPGWLNLNPQTGVFSGTAGGASPLNIVVTATDVNGIAVTSSYTLTITGGSGNQYPTANAGADKTVTDSDGNGSEVVALNGASSSDPDGSITSYKWTENGTQIATGATPNVTLAVGTHTITLTVTDNQGATATDDVIIQVISNGTNPPPASTDLWLEAECATLGSNWSTVSSSSASNSAIVTVKSGYGSAPSGLANDRVRFSFDVSSAGTYRIFGRIRAMSSNRNSFWIRVNGGNWILWEMPVNSDYTWYEKDGGAVQLAAGYNTIDVEYREPNTNLDKLYLTKGTSAPTGLGNTASNCGTTKPTPPTPPAASTYWLEAECATLGSNWSTVSSSSASNNAIVTVKSGYGTAPSGQAADRVRFNFSVSSAGTYHVFGRIRAMSSNRNSFWIRVNGGNWVLWEMEPDGGYVWYEKDGGTVQLNAGANTIDVEYREPNTNLDKLCVTSSAVMPTGLGEAASNCNSALVRSAAPSSASVDWSTVNVSVYPNPSFGSYNVAFEGPQPETGSIKVISLTGVTLREIKVEKAQWKFELQEQAAGMYILQIEFGDRSEETNTVRMQRIQKL
ncbi:Putative Ig domain-containing protein [Catalinimonas alkaloidigena]|uniref:Putative Ig domain-containing protein n=1 Tax=Catalinimonas alkaloidigena TaxID=1075417 RepID=A0A1G9J5E4_9BACT|nr:choice-of-anchor D domain-containing protein [Catalinimonas alkaloidigena]SDL32502.1 Putative Ig domain-containing protein [Catalinimonas alkaloidigena]